MFKRFSLLSIVFVLLIFVISCAAQDGPVTNLPKINMSAWQYNAEDDVYYQLGIEYCETPADENYENLAIFVPGAYFNGTDNSDGTWTCTVNTESTIGNFSAATAPIVIPVNTPGYSAMAPLSEYSNVTTYTNEGFVYVHAGCRGRNHGAPAGVTDLKAAVRYIRYTADLLPGNTESIFTFGMSGGGAQSALMGATGDSELYTPYLEAIGAVKGVSDTIFGSMCWCPITNLDSADEAYEWMMGTTRRGLSDEEQSISDQMAAAFASYINQAGFMDPDGNLLALEASTEGIYHAGSYYGYIIKVIEHSLNNFITDTTFPYDASSSQGGGHGMMGGGMRPDGNFGEGIGRGGQRPEGMADGQMPDFGAFPGPQQGEGETNYEAIDDITRNQTSSGLVLTGTYETIEEYFDAMNANGEWVSYDPQTRSATVYNLTGFVNAFKTASKNLGAFDQIDGGQGENTLFGYGDGKGAHFDTTLTGILASLGSEYAEAYANDLQRTDALGNTVETRLNMYTPLYYLLETEEGYETANVAKHWRIRTGIAQSDTSLTTEVDLALALEQYEGVESVDFETIWAAGHTQAERSGDSDSNFIVWVKSVLGIRF